MFTRHFLSAALVIFISCAPSYSQQSAPEAAAAARNKPTPEELLLAVGIDQEKLDGNPALKEAVRAATDAFDRQMGDLVYKACKDACKADSTLPGDTVLLARFITAAAEAKAPLGFLFVSELSLIQKLETGSNNTYAASRKATDDATRRRDLRDALAFSRALEVVKPDDPNYRFNVGYIYQDFGDFAKAQAIMDKLAPRNSAGFAKAHLWQADQLLNSDRPLTADVLDAAEAHLQRALATYSEPNEIHRRLGELYYFRFVRRIIGPQVPAREAYLAMADEHLSKVTVPDPKLQLTLAEVRAQLGKGQQAEAGVREVIKDLTEALAKQPDHLENRLRLAQALRMTRQFADAATVLREGQNLRADVRYDQELSGVYYFQSLDVRQRSPNALAEQFAALRAAYLAYPTNNYVAHRFIQALTAPTPQEAEYARNTLQALFDMKASGQMAAFLLGFDCRRRMLPQKASDYFRTLNGAKPDATPEVTAGLSTAVISGQIKSISADTSRQLLDAALEVWPMQPDLLMVRAQERLNEKKYDQAFDSLKTALVNRPNDVKLLTMLALACDQLGQADLAGQYRAQAEAVRMKPSNPEDGTKKLGL